MGDHRSGLEAVDAVADPHHQGHVVLHEEKWGRLELTTNLNDQRGERLGLLLRHAGGGFVQTQDPGSEGQQTGEFDNLPSAGRQIRALVATVTAEAEEVDEGGGIPCLGPGQAPGSGQTESGRHHAGVAAGFERELDGLEHGELRKQRGTLECAPEAQLSPPSRGNPAHVTPQEHHSPGGPEHTGRMAFMMVVFPVVRPDQSDDFTTLDPD